MTLDVPLQCRRRRQRRELWQMSPDAGIPGLPKQMGERSSPPPQVKLATRSTEKGSRVGKGASSRQPRLWRGCEILDVQGHR